MKAVAGVSIFLSLAFGLSSQTVTRSFGSVVFPGGTSATTPGVTRNFGSVVFPGGANVPTVHTSPGIVSVPRNGVHTVAPPVAGQNFRRTNGNNFRGSRTPSMVYAYPVFVGNYEPAMVSSDPGYPSPSPLVQAPGISMYPAQSARPVMYDVPPSAPAYPAREPMTAYQPPDEKQSTPDSDHYLLAFKDHTVYSAVAYWFDGDTLHYFTTGSTHNQASVSLLDRELTTRLNKEMGTDFHMPDAK